MTTKVSETYRFERAEAKAGARRLGLRWVYPGPVGAFLPFGPARLLVGRDPAAAVFLEGSQVSWHHAQIVTSPDFQTSIVDLGSTNGTKISGLPSQGQALQIGDVVRIGDHVAVVAVAHEGPEAEAFTELPGGLQAGPVLQHALSPALKLAASDLPVILEGETGTGKEMVARFLHLASGRAGDFVALNCAALPESLAEAELFGHAKGVFTGADRARSGYFRDAHRGTLLLDEIADLPMPLQAKLLRVLEQKAVVPLGETRAIPVDTRIVAAAQEPLGQLLRERKFRADLLARLEGVVVKLPPLRDRREEIPFLFCSRLREASGGKIPPMTSGFVERLCLYDWPFNVRELDLLARRLVAMHGTDHTLGAVDLPLQMTSPPSGQKSLTPAPTPAPSSTPTPTVEVSLDRLTSALRNSQGNVARAAQTVGISRQRAYRLLEGTDLNDFRSTS